MIDYAMLKSLVWSGVDDVTGENVALYEFRPVTHAELVSAEDNSFADPSLEGHEVRFTSRKTGGFHRGNVKISPGEDFSAAQLEKLKTVKT